MLPRVPRRPESDDSRDTRHRPCPKDTQFSLQLILVFRSVLERTAPPYFPRRETEPLRAGLESTNTLCLTDFQYTGNRFYGKNLYCWDERLAGFVPKGVGWLSDREGSSVNWSGGGEI